MEELKGLKGKHLFKAMEYGGYKPKEVAEFLNRKLPSLKAQYSAWTKNKYSMEASEDVERNTRKMLNPFEDLKKDTVDCVYCVIDDTDPVVMIGHEKFDADIRLLWITGKMYHDQNDLKRGSCIKVKKVKKEQTALERLEIAFPKDVLVDGIPDYLMEEEQSLEDEVIEKEGDIQELVIELSELKNENMKLNKIIISLEQQLEKSIVEIPTSKSLKITSLINYVKKLSEQDPKNTIYTRFLKRSDPQSKSYREYMDIIAIINDLQR